MPVINLVGGISVEVDKKTADIVAEMKWGKKGFKPTADPHDILELPNGKFEVGQVKNIIEANSKEFSNDIYNEKAKQQRAITEKTERDEKIYKSQTPFEKTERILRTDAFLLWVARGNRKNGQVENRHEALFQEPIYSKLFQLIFEWFEKNNEAYCPAEVWGKIIPNNKQSVSTGWRRI